MATYLCQRTVSQLNVENVIVCPTMTERCQTKFAEKFDNQNNIIYVGIFVGSLAVIYFYRFHFVSVVFSYVLGCVACYYGLNSRIVHNYVEQWKCHFMRNLPKEAADIAPLKGCETCGSKECNRHDSGISVEPWVGLHIHKQLDLAIEDFYNTILDQFINSWYSKITIQPFFVDELRHQLRYASACLLRRAVKINYSRFITERVLPCALRHYLVCGESPDGVLLLDSKLALHPAAASRHAELRYLRALTNAIMPYLLKNNELQNTVFRVLIREIFAGWVLLSLTDVLADPYILNTLIVLATGDETMAQLPGSPNYKVEFLETFVRQTESVYTLRPKMLRVDLDQVINDQEYFYAFMQYMKTSSNIHLLQFYKDIKTFQTKILNPDLRPSEVTSLHAEACDMYERYFTQGNIPASLLPFADELSDLLHAEPDSVKRLQTSRALYQAARQSHAELEKIMLPKFLHSEEFYRLLIGPRIPIGYSKHMARRQQDKIINTLKLNNRRKGTLKSQAIDGQVLDSTNSEVSDGDGGENMDLLNYLDSIVADDNMREQDLSTCKVVLTNVETRLQAAPRRGPVRVFTVAVHRAELGRGASLWTLDRSEHDFHLLRSKLHEFHGDLLHDLPLPSRRDNSPLETLRYKYEDFLQRLLQKSLLQTSELLHLFLTVDSDFSMVVQASALNANGTDLANMYQSVAHKLRKEKGQHLESFLMNLLVCSDMERFQALKQGTSHVEEAQEVSEELETERQPIKRQVRDIQNSIFGNNFDIHIGLVEMSCRRAGLQDILKGFTQCTLFILTKVIKGRALVANILGSLLTVTGNMADDVFNGYLNKILCDLLSERRLAHLIRLGQGLLFGKKASTPRSDPAKQRELARSQLLSSIPPSATALLGPGLPTAILTAFEIIQKPQLNKQLVYDLLDLCVLELFPELSATSNTKEPKS